MNNIKMSKEQRIELEIRFKSDRVLKNLYNEISGIYNISMPNAVISDGKFKVFYDEKVEYEVNRVKEIIKSHISTNYPELIQEM